MPDPPRVVIVNSTPIISLVLINQLTLTVKLGKSMYEPFTKRAQFGRVVNELIGFDAEGRIALGKLGRDRGQGLLEVGRAVGVGEGSADAADQLQFVDVTAGCLHGRR